MGYSRPAKCDDEPLSLEAGAWPTTDGKGANLGFLGPFALGSALFLLWVSG